ncbi:MAG: AlpA family phage regulatory protein [Litoreibacter sp.]|uniref:helix-turn-helix transcriptional regulator n=1 Tax=Litoreibacter sp. TaxID=1969459 RepID=UPI003296877F
MIVEKHYRRTEVEEITGLCRSTLYSMISEGKFPRPIRMRAKAVAWPESKLIEWLENWPAA